MCAQCKKFGKRIIYHFPLLQSGFQPSAFPKTAVRNIRCAAFVTLFLFFIDKIPFYDYTYSHKLAFIIIGLFSTQKQNGASGGPKNDGNFDLQRMDGYECALGQGPAASFRRDRGNGRDRRLELLHLCFLPEEAFVTKASSALKPRAAINFIIRSCGGKTASARKAAVCSRKSVRAAGPAPVHDRRKRTPGRGPSRTQNADRPFGESK